VHTQIREAKIVRRKVTTEMKELVLGGAGAMYSETTRDLVNTSNLTEITMRARNGFRRKIMHAYKDYMKNNVDL
jgi:hypothetical protein